MYCESHEENNALGVFIAFGIRQPGVEPGPRPWEGRVLPLDYWRLSILREVCDKKVMVREEHRRIERISWNQIRIELSIESKNQNKWA